MTKNTVNKVIPPTMPDNLSDTGGATAGATAGATKGATGGATPSTKTTRGTFMLDRNETMKHMEAMQSNQQQLSDNIMTLTNAITNDMKLRKNENSKKEEKENSIKELLQELTKQKTDQNKTKDNETNLNLKKCDKCDSMENEIKEIKIHMENMQQNQKMFKEKIHNLQQGLKTTKEEIINKENLNKTEKPQDKPKEKPETKEPWNVIVGKRNKYIPDIETDENNEKINTTEEGDKENYLAYAKVRVTKQQQPKIKLTETTREKLENNVKEDIEKQNNENKYENEQIETDEEKRETKINKTIDYAKRVAGIKPISRKSVSKKVEQLKREGFLDENDTDEINFAIAAKTVLKDFMKRNLIMTKEEIKQIKIKRLFFSTNTDVEILYVECEESDDISRIFSHANKLPKGNEKSRPQLVNYVPPMFHERHRDIQSLAYNLRQKYKNQILTNIRLGRHDYILRMKEKDDNSKWSEVPQVELPQTIRPFQVGMKKTLLPIEFQLKNPNSIPTLGHNTPIVNTENNDVEMTEADVDEETIKETIEETKQHQNQNSKRPKLQSTLSQELEKIQSKIQKIPDSMNEYSVEQILNPGTKNQRFSLKNIMKKQTSKDKNILTGNEQSYEGRTQQ